MALIFDNTGPGNVTLKSSSSGTYTLTFPTTAGTNGYFLQTDGSGNLTWASSGGLSSMPDGNATTPGFAFTADADTGFYRPSTNTLGISTAATQRFLIDDNGNVIINTGALATTATDGFLYITGMPGIPTGTPTAYAGRYPLTFDNANKKLNIYNGSAWQDINSPRVKTDSWSATPTIDWSNADVVRMTLTSDTVFTFTGAVDGQRCLLEVAQDGSGNHTVTFGSEVRYGTDITSYTATITASKKDRIVFIYDGSVSKYDVVSIVKGF